MTRRSLDVQYRLSIIDPRAGRKELRAKDKRILEMANKNVADWITARKRHGLSHAHVQMARELGMNPNKLGNLDNHHQEQWKVPLPQFIERLYLDRFGRERPGSILSIEDRLKAMAAKKAEKRARKLALRNRTSNELPLGD